MIAKPIAVLPIALVILSATAVGAKPHGRRSLPRCVRLTLAGVKLEDAREDVILFDPKSGYYLVEGSAGDIRNRDLTLTPDLRRAYGGPDTDKATLRAELKEDVSLSFRKATFPRLRTGSGVNIGDTPHQVQQKLGPPQSRRRVRDDVVDLEWDYHARLTGDDIYIATYSFRHGRLWEISYASGPADQ